MKSKLWKKLTVSVLTFAMSFGVIAQTPVAAAEEYLSFHKDSQYAIVTAKENKAINVTGAGWQKHIKVEGICVSSDGKKQVSKDSLFRLTPTESGVDGEVKIQTLGLDKEYPVRAEGGNPYIFADNEGENNAGRPDQCFYVVEKTAENKGYIKDTANQMYLNINGSEISRTNSKDDAAEFLFVENPTVADFSIYFEHVGTHKLIRSTATNGDALLVNGDKDKITDDCRYSQTLYGEFDGVTVVNFISKAYGNAWKSGGNEYVFANGDIKAGGWESIIFEPNGDGTITFKDSQNKEYITVNDEGKMMRGYKGEKTDNEKFIVHSVLAPNKVTNVKVSKIENSSMTVSWSAPTNSIYSGFVVTATPSVTSGKETITSKEVTGTSLLLDGLTPGTEYEITVKVVNGDAPASISDAVKAQTKNGPRANSITKISSSEQTDGIKVVWDKVENADKYDVYRAVSAYAEYEKIASDVETTEYVDTTVDLNNKYANYYKVVAKNENGDSDISDVFTSLETELFTDHTLIFADTDDTATIDNILLKLYEQQSDSSKDAQFQAGQYQVYFKPGNYKEISCIYLGFYTSINGLGKTPYDVELNNIAIPAYLPDNNATCNFWRSAENLSIMNTGNAQGKAQNGSWRPDQFNWSVAQAAPLRRIYSERPIAYDWNYGWASGGYVADSKIVGTFQDNGNQLSAGTFSGQQFYTRNSELTGNAYGTTLNNFFQGVIAPNLPTDKTGNELVGGNGYSNWNIASQDGGQQVFTNVETTKKLSEKPFLYLDNGEYKVFVPSVKENTKGTSWSKDNMGEGRSISLSEFYVAKPTDTAKTINEQINAGKNIYFTPGTYHAEEPILVNKDNTIVLGTGMASIIPDNDKAAMIISDSVDGVRVSGLIMDAGSYSKCLLEVGEETGKNHSSNPTVLQDIFFRVGGTTNKLTTADDAIIINSHDVLTDHFWIWRADHGTGVAWDGNASKHGLIVNGDNVTCYALFNEHFEEYDTLWNGENGSTYFYQNEKCYDPIDQETWTSHNGAANGYAAYKVANGVKNHYAIGLGIYNVFIYTGGTLGTDGKPGTLGDASQVSIQMDNAIEVPNSEGVIIENACIQTFAKEDAALQKFNHIINEVGNGVSSGIDKDTGETGEGWSRQFLISYQNGTAVVGKKNNSDQKGKYIGVDTIENVKALGDDNINTKSLTDLYEKLKQLKEEDYSANSWGVFRAAMAKAKAQLDKIETADMKYAYQADFDTQVNELEVAQEQLTVDKTIISELITSVEELKKDEYTQASWDAMMSALDAANAVFNSDSSTQKDIQNAYDALNKAIKALEKVDTEKPGTEEPDKPGTDKPETGDPDKPNTEKPGTGDSQNPQGNTGTNSKPTTGDSTNIAAYTLGAMIAVAGVMVVTRRKRED